jgi:hypothetical protein
MNEIRVRRLVLAGFATLLIFIALGILLQGIIGHAVFGDTLEAQWQQKFGPQEWTGINYLVALLKAVFQSTLVIWLYASLRPMYGVGAKTALITSGVLVTLVLSIVVGGINSGMLPAQASLVAVMYEAIEVPLAMLVGAAVYEGREEWDRDLNEPE